MPIPATPPTSGSLTFDFVTAGRILFGGEAVANLAAASRSFGRRALVLTGRNPERARQACLFAEIWFSVEGEPTLDDVRRGAALAREEKAEVVIGFGGGSAMDAAKAIAMLATNSGEPLDYLEVIGKGESFANPPLPVIAVPTTAGTGAEVTRNAVLGSPEHGLKASLRSPLLVPRVAVIDPKLGLSLPREVTAHSGIDALTQLLEAYVSCRSNPITDELCLRGLTAAAEALPRACRNGSDLAARESMALAALFSGMALANAGLGVVHGFAAAAGGMLSAPHGAICAAFLAAATQVNLRALETRMPESNALAKYTAALAILHKPLGEYLAALNAPALRDLGLPREKIPELVEKAARANSTKGNPVSLTTDELMEIVENSY